MIENFKIEKHSTVLEAIPFSVEQIDLSYKGRLIEHPFHRLNSKDWVNIVAVTKDQRAILIRQPRAGTLTLTLETPGGVVDPQDDCLEKAALRELEEETGYTSDKLIGLGSFYANPAIQTNYCHYFLAKDCYQPQTRSHFPDPEEQIEIVLKDISRLAQSVRDGEINHVFCCLAVMLSLPYLQDLEA